MLGRLLSSIVPVTINPVSHYSIYSIGLAANNIDSITQVILNTTNTALGVKGSSSPASLSSIYKNYAEGTIDVSGIEWSFEGNVLTIYTDIIPPDDAEYRIVIIGIRNPNPISSLDDVLDIDPGDYELFISYAIREAAQIRGKVVPPAIEQNILELEGE